MSQRKPRFKKVARRKVPVGVIQAIGGCIFTGVWRVVTQRQEGKPIAQWAAIVRSKKSKLVAKDWYRADL